MKKQLLALLAFSVFVLSCEQKNEVPSAIASDKQIEEKIEQVLKNLTLEQKIGQMTQLTLDVVGKGDNIFSSKMPFELDQAMLDTVIGKYKVGSILNSPTNTPLTPSEWEKVIEQLQEKSLKEIGIPLVYGIDAIHGVTYTVGGTFFPQQIAMAATFNRDLVYQSAQITAYEARASNTPWNFSPVLDLGRDSRWSRIWETYGEDVYLISEMGKACVMGYQGENPNNIGKNNVAACLKHYMGYGAAYSGKDRTPAYISPQDLKERHFYPFLQAIKQGALSVMANSGMINGLPVHASYDILTQRLKKDLNWDGVIVTDWADINNLANRDKVARDLKHAVEIAINAGVDMSMVPYDLNFCIYLKELVQEKKVSIERIDDAVRRIIRMKIRMGLFETPNTYLRDYPDFGSKKHAEVAHKAASEAITLLKNQDNVLPLSGGKKILVAGPTANSMRTLNGGWTLSWQGEKADIFAGESNTILEAIQNKFGTENVKYEPGVSFDMQSSSYQSELVPEIEKAVSAAKNVDYILLCLGENSYCETPGNLDDLNISENQTKLALALAKTGKPIILILNQGRPRIVRDIESSVQAVLNVYLPGNYGGDALADILTGDVNPSGKLPYTYPKYPNALSTYDHKPSESIDKMQGAYDYNSVISVQWAFGFGLSYTKFEYSDLQVSKTNFTSEDILEFTVNVRNIGQRSGKESVLLFVSDKVASLTPDVRRLRGFEKIELAPSQSKRVTIKVAASELSFVNVNSNWALEQGEFSAQIGDQTITFHCTKDKVWTTPNREN